MCAVSRHQCLIYEGSPATHLRKLAASMAMALRDNKRCLYLNSYPMVTGIRSYLMAEGVDVERQTIQGALVLSSEVSHLKDDQFDIDSMLSLLDMAVNDARRDGYAGLFATGDITWEFGNHRNFVHLINYERQLEELFERQPTLSGVCQYHIDTLPIGVVEHGLYLHKGIYVSETLSRINPCFLTHETLASRPKADEGEVKRMVNEVFAPVS